MIKSLSISKYKGIKEEVSFDFSSDSSFHVLFGKNMSGKSLIFKALEDFKEVFLFGMRGVGRIDQVTDTTYTFEFLIDNQNFIYKTILNYEKSEIVYESLILKTKTTTYDYYIRDQYDIVLGEKLEKLFTIFDFDRFKTYLYDLRFDRREFMLAHLRIKDFSDSKGALVLNKLSADLMNMRIYSEYGDIKFFTDLEDSHYVSVLKLVQGVFPNIHSLQYKDVTLDALRFNLNRHRYDHLLDAFRNHVTKFSSSEFFVKVYNQFYKLSGRNLDELTIKSIDVYDTSGTLTDFDELSSGIKKLLLLSMIVINSKPHDMIFIDDLTHNLDHSSTLLWIKHIKPLLKLKHINLVFSTHDKLLLDSQLFDLDALLFMTHKKDIKMHHLNKLGIRKDKKLLNLYLEGFFDNLD